MVLTPEQIAFIDDVTSGKYRQRQAVSHNPAMLQQWLMKGGAAPMNADALERVRKELFALGVLETTGSGVGLTSIGTDAWREILLARKKEQGR